MHLLLDIYLCDYNNNNNIIYSIIWNNIINNYKWDVSCKV